MYRMLERYGRDEAAWDLLPYGVRLACRRELEEWLAEERARLSAQARAQAQAEIREQAIAEDDAERSR